MFPLSKCRGSSAILLAMEITLRELGPARVQATLLVADERVHAAEEQAVRLLGSRVTIKGFRQGTAPLDRLREHLSPRAVEEETTQSIVREVLPMVLERSALHPIIPPRAELRA